MLRQFILEEHGGNEAQADEALRKMGKNRSTYKEWKQRQVLIQFFVASRYSQKRPITYRELLAQYDKMKDDAFRQEGILQFRLIDIRTDRMELTDPNDDPIRAAKALAAELRQRIESGEDFAELAKQYSHGHRGQMGGLWKPRNPAALAEPYDVLAERAQDLESGQVSGPIEVPGHFFVVKLEEKQQAGYRPLSEVQEEVGQAVVKARFDAALEELGAEIVQEVALVDTSRFVDYCLERLYRVATQPSGAP
jgi:parvulin-like peptidyl-prolyl isomerase